MHRGLRGHAARRRRRLPPGRVVLLLDDARFLDDAAVLGGRALLVDGGVEVAEGEVGEILVRSPMVMAGYWQDPDLTATVLDADGCVLRANAASREITRIAFHLPRRISSYSWK